MWSVKQHHYVVHTAQRSLSILPSMGILPSMVGINALISPVSVVATRPQRQTISYLVDRRAQPSAKSVLPKISTSYTLTTTSSSTTLLPVSSATTSSNIQHQQLRQLSSQPPGGGGGGPGGMNLGNIFNQQNQNKKPGETLEEYGVDLTKLAKDGKLDPVIGRHEEIRRTLQILARRTKNNPVLIGEP